MALERLLLLAIAVPPLCRGIPIVAFQYDAPNNVKEAAQRTISTLETESALNSCFSACYHAIVHDSCKHVDELGKRRLAYLFAKCHLQFAGRVVPLCPATGTADAFSKCLSTLDAEGFNTYTLYTTHTDNLCYYLEGREWKADATSIISRLLHSANDTAKVLAVVVNTSENLRLVNEQAFYETRKALNRTLGLVHSFEHSQKSMAAAQEDMHAALSGAMQNYAVVADALKQVAAYSSAALQLQGYIVSNMLMLQTAGFYCGSAAVIWFFTSASRLGDAKIPLITMLLVSAALEAWVLRNSSDYFTATLPPDSFFRVVGSAFLGVMSWILSWFTTFSPESSRTILTAFSPTHAEQWKASDTQSAIRSVAVGLMAAYSVYTLIHYQNYPQLTQQLLRKVEHLLHQRFPEVEEQFQAERLQASDTHDCVTPKPIERIPFQEMLYDRSIKQGGVLGVSKLLFSMPLMEGGSKLYQTYGRSASASKTVSGQLRQRAQCRYGLRPLPSNAAQNPILSTEDPFQFAQLVHLQFVASTLGRFAEITLNPMPHPTGEASKPDNDDGCCAMSGNAPNKRLSFSGKKRSRHANKGATDGLLELSSPEDPQGVDELPSTPPTKRPRLLVPGSNE